MFIAHEFAVTLFPMNLNGHIRSFCVKRKRQRRGMFIAHEFAVTLFPMNLNGHIRSFA